MPNPENLKGKGFDKNPQHINKKGRPVLPDIKKALTDILMDKKGGKTALDAILAALRAKAAKGDIRAAQELLDRAYGKPKQYIDHTSGDEKITGFKVEITGDADKDKTKQDIP